LDAESVRVTHNTGHGFNLSSGMGEFDNCLSSANGKGDIFLDNAFETDTAQTGISIQQPSVIVQSKKVTESRWL
jgi:hypothetical protein